MAMATTTDTKEIKTDIREIKKAVDVIAKGTEANTSAIFDMTLEMRLGFSDLKGQINTLEAKLGGKIDTLDERTKLGFWGFVFRGVILAFSTTVIATLTTIFVSYVLPIMLKKLP
jgi:flagellin-like hook-associated protein FlgL